jgi:hypothetical protein
MTFLCGPVLLLTLGLNPTGCDWKFVLSPPGDPFEAPPLRALALSREKPEGVVEKVEYRGNRRRYAQLRYGSPGSVRITVVLDEGGPDGPELYVDADRNLRIQAEDRVVGRDRTWRLPLQVATVEGEITRLTPRAALFRLGRTGLTLAFAASGYVAGKVVLGGREHAARRMDGDGNGHLTDRQDRVWIDLNNDGRWDPDSEQFLYATILTFDGSRYVARSDELGRRLALEPLEGEGTVTLAPQRPGSAPQAVELNVTLVGRDGSAVGLSGVGTNAIVPVGEYRVGTVNAAFDDPGGGPRWSFIFSDMERRGDPVWYKVEPGASVAIDPFGTLELRPGLVDTMKTCKTGDLLQLNPRLFTGDGLLINTVFRGSATVPGSHDGPQAQLALTTTTGQALETASSGFA